jgi:hypothetical protein
MKWAYGDSWEKYPITEGEVWQHSSSGSAIAVHDLRNPLPAFMQHVDLLYCDPPWNQSNANSFITKARMDSYISGFDTFLDALFSRIRQISPHTCYIEMGIQHVDNVMGRMHALYPTRKVWPITYYRKNPCCLIRGGQDLVPARFDGLDDEQTPAAVIRAEHPATVADLCTGRGLTLLAAHAHGARFFGTELNRRRLAVAIDRAAKQGIRYEKYPVQ